MWFSWEKEREDMGLENLKGIEKWKTKKQRWDQERESDCCINFKVK